MRIDLHSHTTVSDGKLAPRELIAHAIASDLTMLAITDHDSVDAYTEIDRIGALPFRLIPGIEFSTQWLKVDVHVLGLNIDPASRALQSGVAAQQAHRAERAVRIAERLARELRIPNPLAAVRELAHSDHNIGRPHFARYLVESGAVSDGNQAFKKLLGAGKPAYVKPEWAALPDVVGWIRAAGGIAVLAHPARYKLTRVRLLKLIDTFIEAGGRGLEVVSGNQTADVTRELAALCEKKTLLASCGSDFHAHEQVWSKLGQCPPLPRNCRPIWENWH